MSRIHRGLPLTLLAGALCAAPSLAAGPAPAPPVVGASWLEAHLGDAGLVILDARPSLRDYLTGHIARAGPVSVENLRSAEGGVPGQIFPPEVLEVVFGRLGVGPDTQVVVYGAENDPDATFVASVLRMHGHERVSVLDGGLKAWTGGGRAVSQDRRPVAVARPRLRAPGPALAALDPVRRLVTDGGAVLLDVRPQEQFEAGRLPGAVHRFWKRDLVEGEGAGAGMLRETADLEKEYAALGVTKDRPVVVYCNTGHMASHVFYTLRYRLGIPDVRLYDGSWVEWSVTPGVASDKGPARPR